MSNRSAMTKPTSFEGATALVPVSWVYRGAVATVRAFRTAAPPVAAGPRVISIGNLEVGGSGKTPMALWLCERAMRAGKPVAYVSRGFGSTAERGPLVTVLPAQGTAPASFAGLRVVARSSRDLALAVGDEGAVVAARAARTPLVFARDKRRAVEVAGQLGAEIVVVDDGFQSFSLARHVDVLLLDARRPFGNGQLLPAGRLREPPSAIERAHVIVFNGAADAAAIDAATAQITRWLRPHTPVYGLRRVIAWSAATPAATGAVSDALLVAGLAKPADFERTVQERGVRVVDRLVFRDHHRYTAGDVATIRARAGGRDIVTTEKDWVKLARFDWGEVRVWVARLDVDLVGGDVSLPWLNGDLGQK